MREGGRTSVGAAAVQFRLRSLEGDLLLLSRLLLCCDGVEKWLSLEALGPIPMSQSCIRDGYPVVALAPIVFACCSWRMLGSISI